MLLMRWSMAEGLIADTAQSILNEHQRYFKLYPGYKLSFDGRLLRGSLGMGTAREHSPEYQLERLSAYRTFEMKKKTVPLGRSGPSHTADQVIAESITQRSYRARQWSAEKDEAPRLRDLADVSGDNFLSRLGYILKLIIWPGRSRAPRASQRLFEVFTVAGQAGTAVVAPLVFFLLLFMLIIPFLYGYEDYGHSVIWNWILSISFSLLFCLVLLVLLSLFFSAVFLLALMTGVLRLLLFDGYLRLRRSETLGARRALLAALRTWAATVYLADDDTELSALLASARAHDPHSNDFSLSLLRHRRAFVERSLQELERLPRRELTTLESLYEMHRVAYTLSLVEEHQRDIKAAAGETR